ncbi:putative secondary metabolism biosynthetic enzyme [Epichloe bromicola]|uniref:Secondary metabolism biosynthetic enzyme n=1 Tax=Epichloe bromicola TaxID=79588 RepID=A0ABQ0CUV9_9HYPO
MEWFSEASAEVTALFSRLYGIPLPEVRNDSSFHALTDRRISKPIILASIPSHPIDPYRPVHILYLVLTELSGPWPPSSLFYHFTRLTKGLPHATYASQQGDAVRLLQSTENIVKQSYSSFHGFLANTDLPALYSDRRRGFITHRQLNEFVSKFSLPIKHDDRRPVVAILLPDGPLLTALSLAVATYYVAVPIAPGQSQSQLQSDLSRVRASCVIKPGGENQTLDGMRDWCQHHNIKVITAELGAKSWLRDEKGRDVDASVLPRPKANRADQVCMMIFNNSPWLNRELVKIRVHDLLKEAYAAAESWKLTSDDRGLSMASVRDTGLSRVLLAPIVSGGSVVCCSPTNMASFWRSVRTVEPSWFIASQATHRSILANAPFQPELVASSNFRLACGADGYISPQLAGLIHDVFGCASVTDPLEPEMEVTSPSPVARKHSVPSHKTTTTTATEAWEQDLHNWRRGSEPRRTGSFSRRNSNRRTSQNHIAPGRRKSSKLSTLSGKTLAPQSEDVDKSDNDGFLGAIGANDYSIQCDGTKIMPHEIEEAIMAATETEDSPIYRRVAQVLAFPTSHNILVQDVAVILVCRPEAPRVGLRTLHDALLESDLDRVKWPMAIVYMDSLPLRNGEPIRTRLQQRFHLPSLSSDTTYLARHWEATCPPPDTSFMKSIDRRQCHIDGEALTNIINSVIPTNFRAYLRKDRYDTYEAFLAPEIALASLRSMRDDWEEYIRRLMTISTHEYMVPNNIYMLSVALPKNEDGSVNEAELQELRKQLRKRSHENPRQSIRDQVRDAFANTLSCDSEEIDTESNFYQLGGTSDQAERLMRRLRAEFNIDLTHTVLAKSATVEAIARFIEPQMLGNVESDVRVDTGELLSSTRWPLMLLQLLPVLILYPLRRSAQWTIQLWLLSRTRFWEDNSVFPGRISNLILSILGASASVTVLFPLIGIALKWIIVGRLKEGQYPMWGAYHTRWWMVQKITSLCGMGYFDLNNFGRSWYCRLMGAKIGKGVKMNGVVLGEWDLLDIRDGVSLTKCECRPFAAEKNSTMYLARIVIGERSTIGVFSIVAPGTEVLPDTCLGANSSSWEQQDSTRAPTSESDKAGPRIQDPHWTYSVLLTWPIYMLGLLISLTPWLGAQVPVQSKAPQGSSTPLRVMIDWYQGNPAIAFHYVAVMGRVLITPLLFFGFAVAFRYLFILFWGDLPTDTSQAKGGFSSWRSTFMKTLYPEDQLVEMNELVGQHHGARSLVLRLLGAKIGKRICWPNVGPSVADYHLLDIGNDVTFGSNCQLLTSDEHSSGVITIRDEAVLGDHACLLPGVTVGERTMIGFGTLTRRGKEYAPDETFVGAKNGDVAHSDSVAHRLWDGPTLPSTAEEAEMTGSNSDGDGDGRKNSDITLVDFNAASRMEQGEAGPHQNRHPAKDDSRTRARKGSRHDRPFHRAHHLRKAPYFMLSPLGTLGFSMFMTAFTEFYWNVPALSSMKFAAWIFTMHFTHLETKYDPVVFYLLNTVGTIFLTLLSALMALGFVYFMKKALIGAYKPGIYDWDKSSYCQRWQILIAVEKLIQHCYVDKGGIVSLLTGTQWLVLYYRALGARIGNDCALFASGNPSLMLTEPDLIEMGDRVVVDNTAIISHLDRRGSIQLDSIKIGNRCVLRSSSNILMGCVMEDDSCLMEHTLILPGERVKEGWAMHRRPAERFLGNRKGTIPPGKHSTE